MNNKTVTEAQIAAGAAVLCDCSAPKRIGRNAAIAVFDAMGCAASPARCSYPSGDGDLAWPCPRHGAEQPSPARSDKEADIIAAFEREIRNDPEAYARPGEVVYSITQKEMLRFAAVIAGQAQERAPSGEAATINKIVAAFVKQGYAKAHQQPGRSAEAVREFDDAIADLRAALARRATAGTTAAPSSTTFDAWWDAPNPTTGHPPSAFMDVFSARAAWFAATAGDAAPTETDEPTHASWECMGQCPEHRATSAAAPGDLPPLPWDDSEPHRNNRFVVRVGDLSDAMREYGRACIASNAGAAPGVPEGFKLVRTEPHVGTRYAAGLWSRRNWEAALEDQDEAAIPDSNQQAT